MSDERSVEEKMAHIKGYLSAILKLLISILLSPEPEIHLDSNIAIEAKDDLSVSSMDSVSLLLERLKEVLHGQ